MTKLTKLQQAIIRARNTENKQDLEEFARHLNLSVRLAVAQRSNLPEHLVRLLAEDSCYAVRIEIALKTNTPELVEKFFNDDNQFVKDAIIYRFRNAGLGNACS